MNITERYRGQAMAANSSTYVNGDSVYGFLAVTSGTITVVDDAGGPIVQSFPMAAGVYYPIPVYIGPNGGTVTLAGGASGTLLK